MTAPRTQVHDDRAPLDRAAAKIQQMGELAVLEKDEAAAYLGVSTSTFDRLDVPMSPLGDRSPRYLVGTLVRFLRERERRDS